MIRSRCRNNIFGTIGQKRQLHTALLAKDNKLPPEGILPPPQKPNPNNSPRHELKEPLYITYTFEFKQ